MLKTRKQKWEQRRARLRKLRATKEEKLILLFQEVAHEALMFQWKSAWELSA